MTKEAPEDAPLELGPWLKERFDASGLSVRALAQAMGAERSRVRQWLDGKGGMNAANLLTFIHAVGSEVTPVPPIGAPRAVNAEIAHLRTHLEALEATVAAQGEATTKALKALDAGIRRLERQRGPATQQAKEGNS